ncbi:hypothetical protein JHW43_005759 [Diplocarpon mali]|nr:hypothetical protein JHW43_005759 [Diplocarpon mali]
MLSIYFKIATVLLASSLEYTELFQEILTKAQALLTGSSSVSANSSRFTLDMETILPRLIIATKCRDRCIRRQAIALLWSTARREGLCYDTSTVARLCAWVSSIEGDGAPEDGVRIEEDRRWAVNGLGVSCNERWLACRLASAVTNSRG